MVLTKEFEELMHLFARAWAKMQGHDDAAASTIADTVTAHAQTLANSTPEEAYVVPEDDAAKEDVPAASDPVAPVIVSDTADENAAARTAELNADAAQDLPPEDHHE